MSKSLLSKLLVCLVLATLMSCVTSLEDIIDNANDSIEASNSVFLDLNKKLDIETKALDAEDTAMVIAAHDLFSANEDVNKVINTFKREINYLKFVGKADEHVQVFFSSPPSWILGSMVDDVDTRATRLINRSVNKSKLDLVVRWARSFHTDSLWSKKHIKGQDYHSALLELSKIQRSCSMATNLALNEVLRSLRQDSKSP